MNQIIQKNHTHCAHVFKALLNGVWSKIRAGEIFLSSPAFAN